MTGGWRHHSLETKLLLIYLLPINNQRAAGVAASLGVETGEGLLQTGAVVSGHPVSFPYSIITTSQYSGLSILDHATSAAQWVGSGLLSVDR